MCFLLLLLSRTELRMDITLLVSHSSCKKNPVTSDGAFVSPPFWNGPWCEQRLKWPGSFLPKINWYQHTVNWWDGSHSADQFKLGLFVFFFFSRDNGLCCTRRAGQLICVLCTQLPPGQGTFGGNARIAQTGYTHTQFFSICLVWL